MGLGLGLRGPWAQGTLPLLSQASLLSRSSAGAGPMLPPSPLDLHPWAPGSRQQ